MTRRNALLAGATLPLGSVLAFLLLYARPAYDRQFRELQASLGTTDEPLTFMARAIKPGTTRAEVRQYVRGYARLETLPPGPTAPGGTDIFRYEFGVRALAFVWGEGYGSIVVGYNAEGRILGELDASGRVIGAVADLN